MKLDRFPDSFCVLHIGSRLSKFKLLGNGLYPVGPPKECKITADIQTLLMLL